MGILSDVTMGKAKKEVDVKDDSIKGEFIESLKDEVKDEEPEIDERIDIEVNGNEVDINGKDVQNVTADELNSLKNGAKNESEENGKTQTENLKDDLKSYSFGDLLERAFEEWTENVANFIDFLDKHGDEYSNIFVAVLDYALTRHAMENYKDYVTDQMTPRVNVQDVEFPFESKEEMVEAVEKYLEKHPDLTHAEALDKILEHHAQNAVGMGEIFKEIHEYRQEHDVDFRDARHEVMADKIFEFTGFDRILDSLSDRYEDYTTFFEYGDGFDFDSEFQAACEEYKDNLKSDYISDREYYDNMKELYNNVDKISDKIWRTLNEEKNEIVDSWREQVYDLLDKE